MTRASKNTHYKGDEYMRINRTLYEKMFSEVRNTFPELGGILGGTSGIITQLYLDNGVENEKQCCYVPNTSALNEVIQAWSENEIEFYGLFHTHCYGSGVLSEGDKKYVKAIMESMPKSVKKLYFPVIVFPQKEVVAYEASLAKGQLIIKEEKIILEEDV